MVEHYDVIRAMEDNGGLETNSSPAMTSEFSAKDAEDNLVKDLVDKLRQAWLKEDRETGRTDHEWASHLDESLTLAVIGKAFDIFSREFSHIHPELDRCNLRQRATRITFRRDFRL